MWSRYKQLLHAAVQLCRLEVASKEVADLQVQYAARRGFYISLPKPGTKTKDDAMVEEYPARLIPIHGESKGATGTYTTHELNALNARLKDSRCDCLVLSCQVSHAIPPNSRCASFLQELPRCTLCCQLTIE